MKVTIISSIANYEYLENGIPAIAPINPPTIVNVIRNPVLAPKPLLNPNPKPAPITLPIAAVPSGCIFNYLNTNLIINIYTIYCYLVPTRQELPKLLPGNIGYIYASKIHDEQFDTMKAYLANTKGLILDMRCYPKTYMPYIFGRWLKGGKSAFCLHTNMVVDMPGMCLFGTKGINGTDTGSHYKGKLVILVNERSQSASEYASIALASTPGAIVVGDTTAGADGDISIINLPGGGSTMISGIGVLYPDGRETQRVGVKIDKVVRPTLEGIRVRKDEQLEAAIRIIEEQ
ncbi:hypothetical protein CJD36_010895 [Flavipsychrobacter stenotrophus]|uniref:Tail specific protease domain-containing protein n=2 Tax=Flavipsychrobacter stenotrophus TaxID=2077091 RepID=A0A2S7SV42_9BACT|nr:hypothetical protein CJD36_010895 [Flavipsychrobacter stenotrophus]